MILVVYRSLFMVYPETAIQTVVDNVQFCYYQWHYLDMWSTIVNWDVFRWTSPSWGTLVNLTVDKLFPVNSRAVTGPPEMSLPPEAKSMLALIIKPRLLLVCAHGWPWLEHNNQLQQNWMLVQDLNRIVSSPYVTQGQILYSTTNCIPLIWC